MSMTEKQFREHFEQGIVEQVRLVRLPDVGTAIEYVLEGGEAGKIVTKRGRVKKYRTDGALRFLKSVGVREVFVDLNDWQDDAASSRNTPKRITDHPFNFTEYQFSDYFKGGLFERIWLVHSPDNGTASIKFMTRGSLVGMIENSRGRVKKYRTDGALRFLKSVGVREVVIDLARWQE